MKLKIFTLVFCLLFTATSLTVIAGDFPMLHYSVDEGLPSTTVYSIYRDSKGFLWFATDKGIARYNGIKFETFSTSDGMADNEVFLFKEDHQGRLWMSTYNGALCFYKDGIFHTAANTPFLKMPAKQPHIYNITLESDSSISFNFFDTEVLVNVKNDYLSFWRLPSSKGRVVESYSYYKRKIKSNTIEIVSDHYLFHTDTFGNLISKKLREGKGCSIYIPTQDKGYFINIPSYRPLEFAGSDGYVFSETFNIVASFRNPLFVDREAKAYYTDGTTSFLATSNGLIVNDSMVLLRGNVLSSMTQDVAGNYWISSLNGGVYCLKKNFLSTRSIHSAWEGDIRYLKASGDKGVYFVPSDRNVYRLKNNVVSKLVDYQKITLGSMNLQREEVFFMDSTATWYTHFKIFKCLIANLSTGDKRMITYRIDTPMSGITKDVLQSGDRMYQFGRVDVYTFSFNKFINGELDYKRIFNTGVKRIYGVANSDRYGAWFSTLTNMYRIVNDSVYADNVLKNLGLRNFIFCGSKLIGYTHTNQLFIIDMDAPVLKIDTIPPQNCVWDKLYVLDSTHILASTSNYYRILILGSSNTYEVVPIEDLFIPRLANAICVDKTNCYFFKGGDITVVPIATLLLPTPPPRLYFTSVKTGTKEYVNSQHIHNNALDLAYRDATDLVFLFSRVVINGQNIIQQYSISRGYNDTWSELNGEAINLANPGYGDFTIKIRARTLSSNYCTPVVFKLHIRRPFWATWWFVLVLAGVVIGIVIVAVRLRVRYLVLKSEKDHQDNMKFIKSEYKALNALMNPHFVFNTLNNVQGLVNRDDKLAANEYIRVFADLIRQNMHNLSKEMITLQREIDLVVNYLLLEKLRFKELLNYSLEIDDRIDMSEIMVPPLLVQPLVENSIKHGILPLESVEGRVVIRIYERDSMLFIEVRDNGVGLAKAKEKAAGTLHESFAMENIKKRISQLAIILNKKILLDVYEEPAQDGGRQWTVVTMSMSAD